MANKDVLISQIDQFVIGYGMLPYGGIPYISTIMNGYNEQVGVLNQLSAEITFTDQDIADVSTYFANKYPSYPDHGYDDWYSGLSKYLADRIVGGGNGNGNGNEITPEPTPAVISTGMLIIGAAVILLLMMSKSGESAETIEV